MLAGIREILLISTPDDMPVYRRLLGDGSRYGMWLSYIAQEEPGGLPQAFILGRDFVGEDNVALMLGDNIFFGQVFAKFFQQNALATEEPRLRLSREGSGTFGVVELGPDGRALSIEEKPERPRSHYAITGLYFFDNRVLEIAANLKPSGAGRTRNHRRSQRLHRIALLSVERLGRGFAWLDTETHVSCCTPRISSTPSRCVRG